MKLFTIGPVNVESDILGLAARQPEYFRDEHFAARVSEVLQGLLALADAPPGAKAAILTASGTAGMEAAVANLFDESSKVLVVEGGIFGRRFAEICAAHRIPHRVVNVAHGRPLAPEQLEAHRGQGFEGLLVNAHETSTGQLYDLAMAGRFCRAEGMILVSDVISSILADPFSMREMDVDAAVFSANKGLALPPGMAFVVMGERALARLRAPRSVYLDLAPYFANGVRGHTPFTSAVSLVVMLQQRLRRIAELGGAAAIVRQVRALAEDFRERAFAAGFRQFPERPSNAATAIRLPAGTARPLYTTLRDRYGWFINPPTHGLEEEIIKIGHIGALTKEDGARLVAAMAREMDGLSTHWRRCGG
jgi:aspartate aminotransferase-like enzyme